MNIGLCIRIVGLLLMLFSLGTLPSMLLGWVQNDGTASVFGQAFAATAISGVVLYLLTQRVNSELQIRDGFLVTAAFWIVLGLYGSLPFLLSDAMSVSVFDAVFESVSGLTTTGATVLAGLDALPPSILLYRQLLQWLGGIGIIVLAVAVLPMLGIGGVQLYRAESTGPAKDSRLTPRITSTAKALFSIYLGLTVACAAAYYAAGMTMFDAVCHAFSTIAIGGFSTHDASMGYFDSDIILLIACLFMLISAVNFGLHFIAVTKRNPQIYRFDSETKFFSWMVLIAACVTCATLVFMNILPVEKAITHGMFQTISIATTTGFASDNFSLWPSFLPTFLIMLSVMGACAGSTGGGMKAMRILLIFRQGRRELKQLLHPNAVIPLKLDHRRVRPEVVSAVWSFFAVYMFSAFILVLCMLATGLDFLSATSAVTAAINNLGPGLGSVSANYASVTDPGKVILCVAMLLGRLEIFTLLILFTPTFWRP
ncbi:MAG TPA: potassium transporter [Halieaceae bacterium]|nr:potassium transporter [Halieaceae bacterium]HCJ39762.1 potassium transporter [Halieaceae bacterium]|tara:strand:+ start:3461 stop:4909 length:1449 start_codon:yes stop_codon:yes gene_type:complete